MRRGRATTCAAVFALGVCGGTACTGASTARPVFPRVPSGLSVLVPVPAANPLTVEKAELGRRLFFDKRLSRDETLACASCHASRRTFADRRPVSVGIEGRRGRRNAPSLFNRAYTRALFWDGRAVSLEEQALLPIVSPTELGNTHEEILRRLRASQTYRDFFERSFDSADITIERVAQAIATFERTLLSGGSSFDRYEGLGDRSALSASARRGVALFRGKARCHLCHDGPLFTDDRFHNTGIGWQQSPPDLGRFEATGEELDRGAFRTPSLRNAERTAPYMHNGSLRTLEAVIDVYNRGGGPNPNLDGQIKPLALTRQEKKDLVAFLKSLTGS